MSLVANIRYGYQAFAWDAPLSFGLHALVEFNGLILNNRYQADLYRIKQITGLDDADVRDSREARAGTHGEFAYDALYGGRTITITGRIESGSINGRTKLERDLRAAFSPLVEAPLKFRWFDSYDDFGDPLTWSTSGNYTLLAGTFPNARVVNGVLIWTTPTTIIASRTSDKRMFGDVQGSIRCMPGSNAASTVGIVLKPRDASNYVSATYTNGVTSVLAAQVRFAGTTYTIATLNLTAAQVPAIGQQFWIVGRTEGDLVTAELWLTDPGLGGIPTASVSGYLTGLDADTFGEGVLGQVGFIGSMADLAWTLDDFRISSLYPGDVVIYCHKSSPTTNAASQDGSRFTSNFQVTLRASDFRSYSATTSSRVFVPSTPPTPLGRGYPRSYPLSYRRYAQSGLVSQSPNVFSVNNRGNVFVKPQIYVYGAMGSATGSQGAVISNLTNGQQLIITAPIADGDYLFVDCLNEVVTNSSGLVVGSVYPTSAWLTLEPGWNDIYVSGPTYSANSRIRMLWQHGYV